VHSAIENPTTDSRRCIQSSQGKNNWRNGEIKSTKKVEIVILFQEIVGDSNFIAQQEQFYIEM